MSNTTLPEEGTDKVAEFKRQLAEYEESGRILLADCTMTYEEVPGHPEDGKARCVVRAVGHEEPVTHDYAYRCECADSRLELAWLIMAPTQPAAWKTVKLLRTLRQGIRECHVQMMPLDFPRLGASQREIGRWLREARRYDAVHHGEATF